MVTQGAGPPTVRRPNGRSSEAKEDASMISRRQLLAFAGAGVLAPPLAVLAQSAPKAFRIGWISLGKSDAPSPFLEAFRQGLKERGYVEGRNVAIEARHADGSRDRADQMVAALVQSKVDVIVTQGGAAWAAYRHGGTTPVVFGYSGDPVEAKFVESLARPGGTRTGMSFMALELVGKRLEVLAQILPAGARVAVIAHPEHPGEQNELRHSQAAAQDLGLKLRYLPVRSADDVDAAFKSISAEGIQAIVVFPDALTLDQRDRISAFGLKNRLPTVSGWSSYAESGFLMSYGPNLSISYAHLATYVDKILKGAKPADLPVELPTAVEFVINARTAKAIGVRIPQPMLVRADKVID
jgi:putative ABC transport system substrate-binding protein